MKWFQNGLAKMSIIEMTKQYIAKDSSIASPTKRVRVMVCSASGCCAIELSAFDIALPCPKAGNMQPAHVVSPAIIIDTVAINVTLSICFVI